MTAAELGFKGSKDSIVECGHVRTLDRDTRIRRHLGSIQPDALAKIDAALRVSLGF